jgi:hypothetical protein
VKIAKQVSDVVFELRDCGIEIYDALFRADNVFRPNAPKNLKRKIEKQTSRDTGTRLKYCLFQECSDKF